MQLTTGVQADIRLASNTDHGPVTADDVRAVLFAAWPVLFGIGTEIEHLHGLAGAWLVTLPTEELEHIEAELGHFEATARLADGAWIKMVIELP